MSYRTYSGSLLSGLTTTFATSFVYLKKGNLYDHSSIYTAWGYLDRAAVRVLTSSDCFPATRLGCLGEEVTKSIHPERLASVGVRDPVKSCPSHPCIDRSQILNHGDSTQSYLASLGQLRVDRAG